MKKCLYCGVEIPSDNVVDFCERCGKSVFGEKMYHMIIQKMGEAQKRGDLEQGY